MPHDLVKKTAAIAVGAAAAAYIDKKTMFSKDLVKFWPVARSLAESQYLVFRNTRVADLWEELVDSMPSKVLIMFEGRKYTAQQLETQSNRIAHWAISIGLTPGSTVALMMENRPEFITTWIGLSKVGVITALINTHVAEDALLHSLGISGASVIIFGSECTRLINSVASRCNITKFYSYLDDKNPVVVPVFAKSLDKMLPQVSPLRPLPVQRKNIKSTDTMLLIYTSGTTGMPKAARVEHQSLFIRSLVFVRMAQVTTFDRLYCPLPLYHTSGGVVAVGMMLMSGCSLSLARKFSTTNFWHDVRHTDCTMIQYIGEMCRYLLQAPEFESDRANLIRVAIGNGLRPDIWGQFQRRFGIPIVCEFYGATEGVAGMVNLCTTPKDQGHLGQYGYLAAAVSGYEIVQFDVDTEQLKRDARGRLIRCAVDQVGELLIPIKDSMPSHKFQGYLNNSAASDAKKISNAFVEGDVFFRTGDLFRMDGKRRFHFVDRIGDTFRWNGENVSTTEVAEILATFPGVSDVCVYGVALPQRDGRACMVAMDFEALDFESFAAFCTQKLPYVSSRLHGLDAVLKHRIYAVPRFVRQLRTRHVTGTMKHEKAKLRKQGVELDAVDGDRVFYWNRTKAKPTYSELTPSVYHDVITTSRL
ncbi:hypothetical protein LEN26_016962 [Aphanomyces euteiches]|nr:hypothetical protein LEN26_016962 [Aphanomyces euteiches]